MKKDPRMSIPTAEQEEMKRSTPTAEQEDTRISISTAEKEELRRSTPTAEQEEAKMSMPTARQRDIRRGVLKYRKRTTSPTQKQRMGDVFIKATGVHWTRRREGYKPSQTIIHITNLINGRNIQ